MRTLTATLEAEQKKSSYAPLVKIVLTKTGETTRTYTSTRITHIDHIETEDSQTAKVLLHNADQALTDLDLRGFKGVISYGMTTSNGDEYSACAPLWVIAQNLYSAEGVLVCELALEGIPNLMARDKANDAYEPDSSNTDTVKDIMNAVAGATLSCYNHCTAYTITWDSEDSLIDVFQPKDSFRISLNESRWAVIKRLISWTACVIRAEADGNLHVFTPSP